MKGGKKATGAADDEEVSSDEDINKDGALNEDEVAEIKKAKQRERERLEKARESKIGTDELHKIK